MTEAPVSTMKEIRWPSIWPVGLKMAAGVARDAKAANAGLRDERRKGGVWRGAMGKRGGDAVRDLGHARAEADQDPGQDH